MKLMEALRYRAEVANHRFKETKLYSHNLTKGEVRERVLRDFLRPFLPACYGLGSGQVFSSDGHDSKQIDIVIYDAVFSIVMRIDEANLIFPCESVFGSIEVKSLLNSNELETAVKNIRSLKLLKREQSNCLDITPNLRIKLGGDLESDPKKRNPYLGLVFALDGIDGKQVRDQLVQYSPEQRETLPDYVFKLSKKQYMVSRWSRKKDRSEGIYINCGIDDYNGFVCYDLGDDILPMIYLVLISVLNSTRLRQPEVTEKILINEVRQLQGKPANWHDPT